RGCRCAGGDRDDKSAKAAVRENNTVAAPCRCSGEESTCDEAMLRGAPLSTATTSGGGPWIEALRSEGTTRA
uniref:Uncharacterized protein n=1 Tax=Oryza glaberrima TaxID=4538 RepID=I1P694_ORYGL